MVNIFRLKTNEPVFSVNSRTRLNVDGGSAGKVAFDWNNLVSTLGDSIASIFGGLAASKQAQVNAQYQAQRQTTTNGLLWVGIAVVAIIVIAVIFLTRKK